MARERSRDETFARPRANADPQFQYKLLLFELHRKHRLERDTGKTIYIDMLAWFPVLDW